MKLSRIQDIQAAGDVTGLDDLNSAMREARYLADAVERATRLVIDTTKPSLSMRNFTKVLDEIGGRGEARQYALVEFVDDVQEST